MRENNETKAFKLENTLHVPNLCSDLMFVGNITDKGFEILFQKGNEIVFDSNVNQKMFANKISGFHYIQEQSEVAAEVMTESKKIQTRRLASVVGTSQ